MSKNKNSYFIAVDLEFNKTQTYDLDADMYFDDIIQVGMVYGSVLDGSDLLSYSQYINCGKPVSKYITDLTGIDNGLILDSPDLVGVSMSILNWINHLKPKPFINCLTWGGADSLTLQLQFNVLNKSSFPNRVLNFGSCVIDVKHIYRAWLTSQNKYPAGSLADACDILGIPFVGKQHDARWDAYNTIMVYRALLKKFNSV